MARGEVKEAVGQGSSPMREALCLRLKDGAVWEVVLAARCLEWRARASLDFRPRSRSKTSLFGNVASSKENRNSVATSTSSARRTPSKCSSRVGFSLLQPLLPWQCTCVAVCRH